MQSTSRYSDAYLALKDIYLPNFDQQKALQQLSFFLGVKEFNHQNFKEAVTYFSHAMEFPINETYVYLSSFWLADCYFHLRDYHKSIEGYNALPISIDENLAHYEALRKYNIAYSYFQVQDYSNALKWFRSYEKIASDSMKINDAYLRIADAYFMSSDFLLSAKYYNKAVLLDLLDSDNA